MREVIFSSLSLLPPAVIAGTIFSYSRQNMIKNCTESVASFPRIMLVFSIKRCIWLHLQGVLKVVGTILTGSALTFTSSLVLDWREVASLFPA